MSIKLVNGKERECCSESYAYQPNEQPSSEPCSSFPRAIHQPRLPMSYPADHILRAACFEVAVQTMSPNSSCAALCDLDLSLNQCKDLITRLEKTYILLLQLIDKLWLQLHPQRFDQLHLIVLQNTCQAAGLEKIENHLERSSCFLLTGIQGWHIVDELFCVRM